MKNKLLSLFLVLAGTAYAQDINFTDTAFKNALLSAGPSNNIAKNSNDVSIAIDSNNDGEIQQSEALAVYKLSILNTPSAITSLTGIEYFTNLETLMPSGEITSLDVSMLTNLKSLNVDHNSLTSINVTGLQNLEFLHVGNNFLTQLDLSGCTGLKTLYCYSNEITGLNLSNLPMLNFIHCRDNSITELDLSQVNLTGLACGQNLLTVLDINNQTNLTELYLYNSPNLTEVYMKNGINNDVDVETFGQCPNLQMICADESETDELLQVFTQMQQWQNIEIPFITTYCTSTPGGDYNTLTGTLKFDSNNNGCDNGDVLNQFIKLDITDGTETGITYTNSLGTYNFYTQDGSFTITPQLENDWFTVSPQSATVTFAGNNNNTQTQDFCITANGVHPDVEVVLVPVVAAQPGFDAKYKVVCKNKGNQVLSGDVTVNFNDAVTDFVTAVPAANAQAGSITWSYSNLMPFESRELLFTLNVNSPMETPAVNINDVLAFTVAVTPLTGDETPEDNAFALNQVVVGSFDPNDITCLEGEIVPDTKIGEYLHYNINFENTGTAPATFIVVKDIIDTAKYDVSTLQLLNASHEVMANVTGNKAEFRFDNINLGPQQKGNLVFKIKTLNSLAVNDAVMNKAEIFFDYNFPIVTNEANTTFATLSAGNFAIDASVTIYPNPTNGMVNIKAGNTIKSVELFDIQGRLLQTGSVNDVSTAVDVSGKQSGIYFIRIKTNKGVSVEKIVKQ